MSWWGGGGLPKFLTETYIHDCVQCC
jgi:hypothetical protein